MNQHLLNQEETLVIPTHVAQAQCASHKKENPSVSALRAWFQTQPHKQAVLYQTHVIPIHVDEMQCVFHKKVDHSANVLKVLFQTQHLRYNVLSEILATQAHVDQEQHAPRTGMEIRSADVSLDLFQSLTQ